MTASKITIGGTTYDLKDTQARTGWEIIKILGITEDVGSVTIDKDENGNSFELDECILAVYHPKYTETTLSGYSYIRANGKNTLAYTAAGLHPSSSYYKKGLWEYTTLGTEAMERWSTRENSSTFNAFNAAIGTSNLNGDSIESVSVVKGSVAVVATNGSVFSLYGKRRKT